MGLAGLVAQETGLRVWGWHVDCHPAVQRGASGGCVTQGRRTPRLQSKGDQHLILALAPYWHDLGQIFKSLHLSYLICKMGVRVSVSWSFEDQRSWQK